MLRFIRSIRSPVVASAAKQSRWAWGVGTRLLRRCAPRNDTPWRSLRAARSDVAPALPHGGLLFDGSLASDEQFVEGGGEAGEIGLVREPVAAFLDEGDDD